MVPSMRGSSCITVAVVLGFSIGGTSPARAQTELRSPPLPTPVEGEYQGAESAAWNPALLADAPGWQVTYVHRQHLGDGTVDAGGQGDALYFGSPVFGPVYLGAGAAVGYPADAYDFDDRDASDRFWGMFSLAAAFRAHATLALGLLYRVFVADSDAALDGLQSLDAGVTWRPWPYVGAGFAVADLLQPRSDTSRMTLLPYERRYRMEVSARPWGDDFLTIGLSAQVGEVSRRTWLGGGISLRPIEGLTIRGRFDARVDGCGDGSCFGEWLVGTAVEVAFPYGALGTGLRLGEGGGAIDGVDVVARFRGSDRPAIDRPDSIVAWRWSGRLSGADWVRLVEWTEAIRRDDDVAGVLLLLDGFETSVAAAQEVRRAIAALRDAGKSVWCHYGDGSTGTVYVCGAADRALVAPGGGARATGIRTRLTFLRRLLDRLGIRAEIVRVGAYKSAPEQFTEDGPTPEHQEALDAYLDDTYEALTSDLAGDLGLDDASAVRTIFDEGPYTAPELLERGLVRHVAFRDEAEEWYEQWAGATVRSVEFGARPSWDARDRWARPRRVAVLRLDGSIIDGKSIDVPVVGIRMIGDRTFSELADRLRTDPAVAAVVLRVDSGGGSATASDTMWRAIRRLRERKPVVAQIGGIGASGGYYVASAADRILVLPSTLTGSIGIFYGKADLGDLLQRLGVNSYEEGRGDRATMESMTRPYTADEIALLEDKIDQYYGLFLDRVVEGRDGRLTREQVDAAGQGRIWSGTRAVELGLADGFGGLGEAVAAARELAGLPADVPVVDAEEGAGGLLGWVLGALAESSGGADAAAMLAEALRLDAVLGPILPLLAASSTTPLALLPYLPEPEM
jgi:protease-4